MKSITPETTGSGDRPPAPIGRMQNISPGQKAEPPRELGRDERRLIFAEIDSVYLGPEDGYEGEWSDEKLALSLGVPRAWITTVREEFFGPEKGDNAKLKAALDRLTLIEGDVKNERAKIEEARTVFREELERIEAIAGRLGKAIDDINAIRQEIGGRHG